ncbi:MAG: hypothetical protein Q6K81_06330, partial [Gloeomargarita sp. DG02_5_bins_242]
MTNAEITTQREGSRIYASPYVEHVSMGGTIRGALFWLVAAPLLLVSVWGVSGDIGKEVPRRSGGLGGALVV